MMNIQMSTKENFASFIDKESGKAVFVDSFDNVEFDVRIGSLDHSDFVGSVRAETDDELTARLNQLVQQVAQYQMTISQQDVIALESRINSKLTGYNAEFIMTIHFSVDRLNDARNTPYNNPRIRKHI